MDWFGLLIAGLLVCCLIALFVHAVMACRDQARAVRAGEPVGSLWQHMMLLHRRREAERKSKAAQGAKSEMPPGYRPKPLTEAQQKALNLKEHKPAGSAPAPKKAVAPRLVEPAAPPPGKRPEPLSKPQRKALGLPAIKAPKAPAAPPVEQTRAIRTGWRLCGVEFMYQDSKGNTTFRTVTVHSVGASSFKGECHHREAERTFRFDRVIGDITDTETGEMLKPKKWAAQYG